MSLFTFGNRQLIINDFKVEARRKSDCEPQNPNNQFLYFDWGKFVRFEVIGIPFEIVRDSGLLPSPPNLFLTRFGTVIIGV